MLYILISFLLMDFDKLQFLLILFLEMNFTVTPTSISATANGTLGPNNPVMNDVDGFTTSGILKAFFVAVVIFVAIIGNLVVSVSFTVFRYLRSMTNYFLVSLSISDILISTCVMPIYLLYQLHSPRVYFTPDRMTLLKFWQIVDFFLCLTSVWTLTAIAVERNLAISQPFYYTKWISPIRVYVSIAVLWMFSLTVSVITNLDPFGQKSHLSVFIVCASYFLPFIIILIMYAQIWRVARRQARRLRQDGALATDFKAITTIAIVIGTFFVCYTPYMVLNIWFHFSLQPSPPVEAVTVAKWLTYFNSCANPIIYSCFNRTYRTAFKRLFDTIAKKLHELRTRAGDKKARKLQRSRLSLNITMRSSAGSLLDGSKLPSASGQVQSRGSIQSMTQNVANLVDPNLVDPNVQMCKKQDEEAVVEPEENTAQNTQE